MKYSQGQNKLLNSKRTRTTLTLKLRNKLVFSLQIKLGILQFKLSILISKMLIRFKIRFIFLINKTLRKSIDTKKVPKTVFQGLGDTIMKSTSQKSIKFHKEIFKRITQSKKDRLIFQDDKINVYFVKEVNKFIQACDTKIPSQDINNREQAIRQIIISKVSIKRPIAFNQNLLQARITQGILSNPKHLFSVSNKRLKQIEMNPQILILNLPYVNY
ncbi:unnamed protein product (macronuclear) [Paramecium tetraurelia]|uniref:Transmembrane protein n=1 Tax=Paramecium tetraurelia TaxID=5888 RepID=A0D3L7_PARTE|nr:uncharacterized protein GSPATT00013122001 [Paramecium tetraurelia]CAK77634.1 unnamed protein product [Paramecium tetraurelia]|eukprot:XP_001445031.1 hypothetical protein (macronuclear) [Paramecium tetraurelia strain d4-2]